MSERRLWHGLRDWLASYVGMDLQRHEDYLSAGIPDVSFGVDGVDGWLELKWLPRWPVRPDTLPRFKLTPIQQRWLTRRGERGGGSVFVLAGIGTERILVHWSRCSLLRFGTRDEICSAASLRWEGWPVDDTRHNLILRLTRGLP